MSEKINNTDQELLLLSIIGKLSGSLLHELTNPLSIGLLGLDEIDEYLEQKGLKDKFLSEKIENQYKSFDRMRYIVKVLRNYIQQNTLKNQSININKLLEDCISLMKPIFDKEKISVNLNNCGNDINIIASYGKLQFVIVSLLVLIRDMISESIEKLINIETKVDQNELILEFNLIDKTINREKESLQENIYFNLSKSFITELNGDLNLIITNCNKASYLITLPVQNEFSNDSRDKTINYSELKIEGNVLIVEDEIDMLKILERCLTKFGLEVDSVSNGYEAIELLKKNTYRFLITDIKMPDISGEQLLKEAKRLNILNDTIIIVATGGFILERLRKGGNLKNIIHGYIQKPFSKEELYSKLKEFD